jgi:hypothetical protein
MSLDHLYMLYVAPVVQDANKDAIDQMVYAEYRSRTESRFAWARPNEPCRDGEI